ncbi:hypothetical protein [Streptomyces sp. NPDC048611]|uniref:DUF6924 domain-containing protein n=1 Tax=Streptomyces sp. NPDC048611 TaxID=3155635 RepID=UPI00341601F6
MTTETKDLYVEDHDLLVNPLLEGILEFPEHSSLTNGLIGFHKDFGTVLTGCERGYLRATVETHSEPPALNTAEWDDVLDISADFVRGQAFVASYNGHLTTNLAFDGPGTYRIRVHARGRSTVKNASLPRRPRPTKTSPPPETYLVQVWTAPTTPEQIHKSSDHTSLPAADYTGPTASPYQPAVKAPKIQSKAGGIVVIRTCSTNPEAWQSLQNFLDKGAEDGGGINVTSIDNSAYNGLTADQLRTLVDRDDEDWPHHRILLIADDQALATPDFPLLAVDNPPGEPTPSFRIPKAHLENFVVNMDLGNTFFSDWSRDADEDGIYRGTADGR